MIKFIKKYWLYIISVVAILLPVLFLLFSKKTSSPDNIIPKNTEVGIEEGSLSDDSLVSNKDVLEDYNIAEEKVLKIPSQSCVPEEISGYKQVNVLEPGDRIYTTQNSNYYNTSKDYIVSGDIDEAFLCIVADVSDVKPSYNDYRKRGAFNAVVKVKFGVYQGAINVGYSPNSNQYYDGDSDNSQPVPTFLDGKFWTHQAPYRYYEDLSSVVMADEKNGRFKYYPLINELYDGNTLRIGGYMTALAGEDYRASSIKEFVIFYVGDGTITPVN